MKKTAVRLSGLTGTLQYNICSVHFLDYHFRRLLALYIGYYLVYKVKSQSSDITIY